MTHLILQDIEILLGLALVTVLLFHRLRIPSIIGFLAAGILAGPHTFALIKETHQVEQLAEVGVVLLLFTIGIEFSIKELARIKHLVLLGGGLQILLTIAVTAAFGSACGFSAAQSVFFGFLTALSSSAILIKVMADAGEIDTPQGKTILGILIFQDLCVVPLMLFVPVLGTSGHSIPEIPVILLKTVAVIFAAHYSARVAVPWIFEQVVKTRSREVFILMIIFIVTGTAWLTAWAGLSLALGAFIAGLAISESEYSHQALGDIMPFRDAFLSLFFISIGMLLNPVILLDYPLLIIALIAGIILIKTVISLGAVMALGLPMRIALISALSLAQIGEFSFVLSRAGMQHGLFSSKSYQIFLAASIGTMGLTPILLKIAEPFALFIVKLLPHSWTRGRTSLGSTPKRPHAADHVIIAGYGVNGKNLAKVLKHLDISSIVIETNPFTVNVERKKGTQIIFGDASKVEVLEHGMIVKARILVIAISDAAATRRIASLARQMNPSIHIIARTRYLLEVEPLFKLGVNEVIPEEFETSVEILSRVLKRYLVPQDKIENSINEVRKDGYEMLRTVSKRHSHAVGIAGFLSGAEIGTYRVSKGSPLVGKSLREGTIRSLSGATVLVIKRGTELISNPDPVWEIHAEDVLLLLGTVEQLSAAGKLFSGEPTL